MNDRYSAEVTQLMSELSADSDSLKPFEMPFTWDKTDYVVREASEGAALEYRQKYAKALKTGKDGDIVSMDLGAIAETESFLVAKCLFKMAKNGTDQVNPHPNELRAWPRKVVKRLHKLIMKVSEIRDDDDTIEQIDQQIEELQKRKEQLLNGKASSEEKVKNE